MCTFNVARFQQFEFYGFTHLVWPSIIIENVSLYVDDPYTSIVFLFLQIHMNQYLVRVLSMDIWNQYIFGHSIIPIYILYSFLPNNCNNDSYLLPIWIIIINVLNCFVIYTISSDKTIWNKYNYTKDYISYR